MKIKETLAVCPVTGEFYTRRELVPSTEPKEEKALQRYRQVAEIVINQAAASEAFHMWRHKKLRADRQKIGF